MGDWTEHLCPCPSKLRWALPAGARRQLAKGGRTDRWSQMTAIRSRIILLITELNHHRLEAGGFASRLQARLNLSPNWTRHPQASASAVTQGLRAQYRCHADSDVLEVIA